jgi:Stress responsive A/B Barrel Domain
MMLKHVVLFKFKPEVKETDIVELEKRLAALPGAIPEIQEYVFGRDVIRSERSYDFALISGFADLKAMERYQKHPNHLPVLELVKRLCSAVLAVDFHHG